MVVLGLVGVRVVLSPRLQIDPTTVDTPRKPLGALVVLLSAVFAALAAVFVRQAGADPDPHRRSCSTFRSPATLLSLLTLPWGWAMPSLQVLALLGGKFFPLPGSWARWAQILLTTSYRHADASLIAPFEYTSMLLAIIVGYTIFGEVPGVQHAGGRNHGR